MEAKRQDIGMDIDENKKEETQKSTSAVREILSWVLTFALAIGAELSDHQRRCADRLHGKYDHAGGPPDRKSSRIFKGYTGARGCCDFPLSG